MSTLLLVLLSVINLVLLLACTYFIATRGVSAAAGVGWTPVELVTTVLSALSILITVLGIFLAVLAVWGYAKLADEAKSIAERVAREQAGRIMPSLVSKEVTRTLGTGSANYGEAAAGEISDDATGSGGKNTD